MKVARNLMIQTCNINYFNSLKRQETQCPPPRQAALVLRAAKARKTPITGIILNRVYNKSFELSIDNIEKACGIKVLAVIPHEINVVEALAKKTPASIYKNSEMASEYKKLAGTLVGEEYKEKGIKSFFKMFRKNVPQQEINRAVLKRERAGI